MAANTTTPKPLGRPPRPALDRFFEKVDRQPRGCWLWTAFRDEDGYGQFYLGGRSIAAHRAAYILLVGEPGGLDVHHRCENTSCVNPAHLELRVKPDHVRYHRAKKSSCKRGHPLSGPNLYRPRSGKRQCRTCRRDQMRRQRAKV